jgi:phosphoglycolate phosphatase
VAEDIFVSEGYRVLPGAEQTMLRAELTTLAIGKAARLHGQLALAQVYVAGDTPHDMEATTAAGAVPVGVASGHYSAGELKAAGGVHVLGSLEEPFPGLS